MQEKESNFQVCVPDGTVKTVCELCPLGCGMEIHIKDGELVKVSGDRAHPLNEGFLCPKGLAVKDFVYSKNRITSPMKKVHGDWHRITWDEALDICAEKLQFIKDTYGPKSLAITIGMPILLGGNSTVSFLRRFCDIYGTPNCFSVESLCFRCRIIANILTLGKFPVPDIPNAKTIMVWGNNPHASMPPVAKKINKAVKKGTRLIVVDPRKTDIAKKADIHLQIRPGTDCALALGIINVIINEELYDKDFVTNWTIGFDELKKAADAYDPESVEKITLIPAGDIKKAARLFASNRPSCILQGNPLDQHLNALQNSRILAILFAITGNVDKTGGMLTTSGVHISQIRLPEKMEGKPLGVDKFPLFYEVWGRSFGEGQGMMLADTILNKDPYPIAGMIIAASNPLLTWPNSNKMKKAIKALEFSAVMDMRMTPTAQLCDLFLPAASFLERTELCDYYGTLQAIPFIALRRKILQVEGTKSDVEFWFELGRRMGYEEFFPWDSVEDALDYALAPTGLTIEKLKEQPGGMPYGERRIDFYKEKKGFLTPSGKVELFSKTLEEFGHDPVPLHQESPESPVTNKAIAKEYPFILTTGARTVEFLHSEYRDIPKLKKKRPGATAEIHPDIAEPLSIKDGEEMIIENKMGTITIKACVTEDILPGVVNVPHGWEDSNINLITDNTLLDPITGYPPLKSLSCRIRKKDK